MRYAVRYLKIASNPGWKRMQWTGSLFPILKPLHMFVFNWSKTYEWLYRLRDTESFRSKLKCISFSCWLHCLVQFRLGPLDPSIKHSLWISHHLTPTSLLVGLLFSFSCVGVIGFTFVLFVLVCSHRYVKTIWLCFSFLIFFQHILSAFMKFP